MNRPEKTAPQQQEPGKNYSTESRLIYGKNVSQRWDFDRHVVPPISASTSFRFRSVEEGADAFAAFADRAGGADRREFRYIYDRLDEPNKDLLEEHLAIADEGDIALVFSTGMAAISALLAVLLEETRDGVKDKLIVHMPVYGCTNDLLRKHLELRLRFPVQHVDLSDPTRLADCLTPDTRAVYCETPANPTMKLVDIAVLARVIAEHNAKHRRPVLLVVDNTFASPYCQRPLTQGADFVCYSLTKSIGGFGTVMGGSVVTTKRQMPIAGQLIQHRKDTGGSLSPNNAWHILVYGISTLPLRMRRMQETAAVVARFLDAHPKVGLVSYPGLASFEQRGIAEKQMVDYEGHFAPGNMIYFEPEAASPEARRKTAAAWMNQIAKNAYVVTLAVSLGQIRTLVEHPGGMTHAVVDEKDKEIGHIDPGGIRLSVGIEMSSDIISDLEAGLATGLPANE